MSTMLGNAKPNQLAKFITPPLSGKILQKEGKKKKMRELWECVPLEFDGVSGDFLS